MEVKETQQGFLECKRVPWEGHNLLCDCHALSEEDRQICSDTWWEGSCGHPITHQVPGSPRNTGTNLVQTWTENHENNTSTAARLLHSSDVSNATLLCLSAALRLGFFLSQESGILCSWVTVWTFTLLHSSLEVLFSWPFGLRVVCSHGFFICGSLVELLCLVSGHSFQSLEQSRFW